MLLINFLCLFYLMVLVRCSTMSKSATNTESIDDFSDVFNVQHTRQGVPDIDPVSRSPKRLLRKHKRPWVFTVPVNNYQSTAALEYILDNIKYKNMKQIASSPFGSTGMVFITQPGYEKGVSTVRQNRFNEENDSLDKTDADYTTPELDELIYIDTLRIKDGKNKRRMVNDKKNNSAKKQTNNKEKEKSKFSFKDFFKFLHPKGSYEDTNTNKLTGRTNQELLKEVTELSKEYIKPSLKSNNKQTPKIDNKAVTERFTSISSVNNVSQKLQRYKSKKEKVQKQDIRHERTVDVEKTQENHKRFPNFMKRDPHSQALDSRVYEALSNKLAYKDFVNGYKYYLNFEKDMAKSNFSDLIRYQAHKHHKVDDIGKFILEKLPPVPTTVDYESKLSSDGLLSPAAGATDNPVRLNDSADSEYDMYSEKYDVQTKTLPSTPNSLNLLKKRLIDFRRPQWLSVSMNSYSDSKTRNRRVRRQGVHFDPTQFPHSLKTERTQHDSKNMGFAKVTLVETAKTKKPFMSLFGKLKKHHSKRAVQRASRSNFLHKVKQLFSNRESALPKTRPEGYDYPSHFYDIMKDHYPFYKSSETNDILHKEDDKPKKQLPQSHTNRFSMDDYEWKPMSETTEFSVAANFHVDPEVPFELVTPMVRDPSLRKELHKLQQSHDYVSSKMYEADLELSTNAHRQEDKVTIGRKGPDTIKSQRPKLQHSTKLWQIDSEIEDNLKGSTESWETNEPELQYKQNEYQSPKSWQKNGSGDENRQMENESSKSWKNYEREYKNSFKDLAKSWETNDVNFKTKHKGQSSKIGKKSGTNLNKNLNEQPTSRAWKLKNQEFEKVTGYDLNTKTTYDTTEVMKKANPANHFNIKPSMFNTLSIDEITFHVTDLFKKQITNSFTTDKMLLDTDKVPELKVPEVKTNKMPINIESDPESDVTIINSMNEIMNEVTTETKDINDDYDEYYMKDDHGINKKEKKTEPQESSYRGNEDDMQPVTVKVRNETNDNHHSKITEKKTAIHNELIHGAAHKKAKNKLGNSDETTRKLDAKTPVNAQPVNISPLKEAHRCKTGKGNCKEKQSRPQHPQSTSAKDLNDIRRKLLNSTRSTEKTQVTSTKSGKSPMLHKFDKEFPEFKKVKNLEDMENILREWFYKTYPDLMNTSEQNKEGHHTSELSDLVNLIKTLSEKHNLDYNRTYAKDVSEENPNADKKVVKSGIKGDTPVDVGRLQNLNNSTRAKFKLGPQILNFKKEENTTLDIGRLVKDWLDSFNPLSAKTKTERVDTKNDNKLNTVLHVMDWPELDNLDDKKSKPARTFSGVNDFTTGGPDLDRPMGYTKKTLPNDKKQTTISKISRYVFDPAQNDEYGPQKSSQVKNGQHQSSLFTKSDKQKLTHSGYLKSQKSKEKEQESGQGKIQILRTLDIILAHGKMPFDNQSFSKIEAVFGKYSNLKKRNLRKLHLASKTVKIPILRQSRRLKRLTPNSEDRQVCPHVTPDPEMVDKKVKNNKRETNEKHVVKNVAALEVLMDMMRNNDEMHQTSVEKPTLKSHDTGNSVQVHLTLPGNIKRSLKRVRKIFTAKLSNPVDLEYQIHSYDDTLDTTTSSVLPSGMYLLVDYYNSTTPRGHLMLGPIPNDLSLSRILERPYGKFSVNPDIENKKVEKTTQSDISSKLTLSKEFISAVNEHLVQLYDAFVNNGTKFDETTRQFNKVPLSNDFMTVNVQRPAEIHQTGKDPKFKLNKRETKTGKEAFLRRSAIKKSIFEKKECNHKPEIALENCPVNDEIMRALVLEMNNLIEYMHGHCTEVQTFFRNNPSGGRKLRDTVRKINKLVNKYSKNVSNLNSYYSQAFNKTVRKRHAAELVDVPQKFVPSNLIDDIEHLASGISNVTKFTICLDDNYDRCNDLVGVVDKCVLGENDKSGRSVTHNDQEEYSLDKVKVKLICKTDSPSTTPQQQPNQVTLHWFVGNVNEDSLNKRQWSLKNLLWRNKHMDKKSKELMNRSWKREVGSIDSPLNADTGGSFWTNYMHKFQKSTRFENKRTTGETDVTDKNKKGLIHFNVTKQESTTAYVDLINATVQNKCSRGNNGKTALKGHQRINETSRNNGKIHVLPTSTDPSYSFKKLEHFLNETNTKQHLNVKKERKVNPKHKEKHTKMTENSKPVTIKGKSNVIFDDKVFNEGDNDTTTREDLNNTNPTQSTPINSNKDGERVDEEKINNKSAFALKLLFKMIPGYNTSCVHNEEKYKHSDVTLGPVIHSATANSPNSTTSSITPSLVRNVINQISKTGDRTFKQWNRDNTVKYSDNINSGEAKEPDYHIVSNETLLSKRTAGEANDDDIKYLLLSILTYETNRIASNTVVAETNTSKEEQGYHDDDVKESER